MLWLVTEVLPAPTPPIAAPAVAAPAADAPRDAGPKQVPLIREEDLVGFKYFDAILPLLSRLHDDGCARDKAHNRTLHFDQYAALNLLFFFNPIVTSMRGLCQASTLEKVRQKLGVAPTSLGSFSEAASVFDAELLEGVIRELGIQLTPLKHDKRLDAVRRAHRRRCRAS